MDGDLSFLLPLTPWHWFILAGVLITIEIMAPSTLLLWPGIAAGIVGAVMMIDPALSWQAQTILFAVMAVGATVIYKMFYGRPLARADGVPLNRRAETMVGRRATVTVTFQNGRGAVNLDDTRWPAETVDGSDPAPGTHVEVVAVSGNLLRVRVS